MSRPKKLDTDRVSTALRLPRELHARIQSEAEARDVAVNWLICRLLTEGMERLVPVEELTLTRDIGAQP